MKIQNEVNKRIKKPSQFYQLIKGLLRNKDINKKFILRQYYFMEKRPGQQQTSGCGNEIFEISQNKGQDKEY